jgi:hypothetical protein
MTHKLHEKDLQEEREAMRWMSDPPTEDQLDEHMRRFFGSDGLCLECRQPAANGPCGLITIKIAEAAIDNGKFLTHEFCSWECLAHWFAERAGGVFVVTCVNTAADLHNE